VVPTEANDLAGDSVRNETHRGRHKEEDGGEPMNDRSDEENSTKSLVRDEEKLIVSPSKIWKRRYGHEDQGKPAHQTGEISESRQSGGENASDNAVPDDEEDKPLQKK
jgi:hypothetical protein